MLDMIRFYITRPLCDVENRLKKQKAVNRPLLEVVLISTMRSDDRTGLVAAGMERNGPDWKNVQ